MKRLVLGFMIFLSATVSACVSHVQTVPGPSEPAPGPDPKVRHLDLTVLQLEVLPDPVREGQRMGFEVLLANRSRHSALAHLFIKDRDEVVAQAYEVWVRPGENRISFPPTSYRFSRWEPCFTVEVDIDRTRRPIDLAREFCLRQTPQGWTMKTQQIGRLVVEDLEFSPDPITPGREVRFKATLRNEGPPLRANIRILDRDQLVVQMKDVFLPRGTSQILFPNSHYLFQRFDHCFTVQVDVERTPYQVDAVRHFCAKPAGWTLKPPRP
ncbi:MAG: hypothetical protein N3G78_09590 [Desulfobacterota bacterium]|nr:hypothetical protein [Thermodesulfobacteriota bacterium]